jgi:hypothetical protein
MAFYQQIYKISFVESNFEWRKPVKQLLEKLKQSCFTLLFFFVNPPQLFPQNLNFLLLKIY